jgi:hypothetical protein
VIAQAAPLATWPQQVTVNGSSLAGTIEQLVIGFQTTYGTSYIEFGTFETDNSLTFGWDSETGLNYNGGTQLIGMHVGNFDNQMSNGSHNPGWQLETYTRDGSTPYIRIFNINVPSPLPSPPVTSQSNWLTEASNRDLGGSIPGAGGSPTQNSPFAGVVIPGDFQGRSLRLGQPDIVRIPQQIQPDLVLGMPPMHIDWVNPNVSNLDPLAYPGCQSRRTHVYSI